MPISNRVYNRAATGHKDLKIYSWESVFTARKISIAVEGSQFEDGRNLVDYPSEKDATASYYIGLNAPVFQDEFYQYVTPLVRIRVDHSAWYNDFLLLASNYVLTGLTGSLGEVTYSDWQNSVSGPNREVRLGRAYAAIIDMHTRYFNHRGMNYDEPAILFQNIFTAQSEYTDLYTFGRDFPSTLSPGASTGPTAPWLSVYYHPSDKLQMAGVTYGISEKDIVAMEHTSLFVAQGLSGASYAIDTIFSSMKTSIDLRRNYTPNIAYPKYVLNDDETTTVLLPSIREYSTYDTTLELSITGWNLGQVSASGNFNSYDSFHTFVYGYTNSSATGYVSQAHIRQILFADNIIPYITADIADIDYEPGSVVFDPSDNNFYRVSNLNVVNTAEGYPSDLVVTDDADHGYILLGSSCGAKMQICKNAAHSSAAAFVSQWTLSGAAYISKSSTGSNKIPMALVDSTAKYYTRSLNQTLVSGWTASPMQGYNEYFKYSNTRIVNFSTGPYYWTRTETGPNDYNLYSYDTVQKCLGKTADLGQWNQHVNDPRALTYNLFDKITLFNLWGQTGPYIEGNKDSTLGCNYSPHQYTPEFTLYAKPPLTGHIQFTETNVKYYFEPHSVNSGSFDKNPYFFNFILSLHEAHHLWLMKKAFLPAKTYFPDIRVTSDYSASIGSKKYLALGEKPFAHTYALDILAGHTGPGYASPDATGFCFCLGYGANMPMNLPTNYSVNINNAFRGLYASADLAYNGVSLTGNFKNPANTQYGCFTDLVSRIPEVDELIGGFGGSGDISITSYNGLTSSPKDSYGNIYDLMNCRYQGAIDGVKTYIDAVNYFDELRSEKLILPFLTPEEGSLGGPYSITNLFNNNSRSVLPASTEYDIFNYIRSLIFDYDVDAFALFRMPQLIYRVGATGVSGAIKLLTANDRYSRVEIDDFNPAYSVTGVPESHGRSPVALFTSNATSGQPILKVQFIDQSLSENNEETGDETSWQWYFNGNDTVSSTLQNPVFDYYSPGVYDVTLRVTNTYGSDTYSISGYITVLNVTSQEREQYGSLNTNFITDPKLKRFYDGRSNSQ